AKGVEAKDLLALAHKLLGVLLGVAEEIIVGSRDGRGQRQRAQDEPERGHRDDGSSAACHGGPLRRVAGGAGRELAVSTTRRTAPYSTAALPGPARGGRRLVTPRSETPAKRQCPPAPPSRAHPTAPAA